MNYHHLGLGCCPIRPRSLECRDWVKATIVPQCLTPTMPDIRCPEEKKKKIQLDPMTLCEVKGMLGPRNLNSLAQSTFPSFSTHLSRPTSKALSSETGPQPYPTSKCSLPRQALSRMFCLVRYKHPCQGSPAGRGRERRP